jgi:hypothetical protein
MLVEIADPVTADKNLYAAPISVLNIAPDTVFPMECKAYIKLGDGVKDLDGTGGDFQITVTVGNQTIQPASQVIKFSTAVRSAFFTVPFIVPANETVDISVLSPNAGDTDVTVTSTLYDVSDTWVDKNKRGYVKDGDIWYVEAYKPDGTTVILQKVALDKDGNNLTDLAIGEAATEGRSTV